MSKRVRFVNWRKKYVPWKISISISSYVEQIKMFKDKYRQVNDRNRNIQKHPDQRKINKLWQEINTTETYSFTRESGLLS